MSDNADSEELLSVVAAVHHERVGETLDDGALSLAETLGGIATGRVGEVDGGADLDVVAMMAGQHLCKPDSRAIVGPRVRCGFPAVCEEKTSPISCCVSSDTVFRYPPSSCRKKSCHSTNSTRLFFSHTTGIHSAHRGPDRKTHVREISRISTSS